MTGLSSSEVFAGSELNLEVGGPVLIGGPVLVGADVVPVSDCLVILVIGSSWSVILGCCAWPIDSIIEVCEGFTLYFEVRLPELPV